MENRESRKLDDSGQTQSLDRLLLRHYRAIRIASAGRNPREHDSC